MTTTNVVSNVSDNLTYASNERLPILIALTVVFLVVTAVLRICGGAGVMRGE